MGRPVEFTPIEIKVDALLQESAFYLQSYRTIEAQNVLNEALRLVESNEVNWQLRFAVYRNMGESYIQVGNIDEGIRYFIKSYEVNQDGNVKAAAANMIASYFLMKGDNIQAQFYADKVQETTKVPELLSKTFQIYGAIALAEGDRQKALEQMNKAAELAEKAHCLTDLSMIIMDMSTVFQSMGMMETALSEVCRAERYVKELVKGNEVQLWNNVWLKPELLVDFPILSVCNMAIRDAQTPVIAPKEVSIFDY